MTLLRHCFERRSRLTEKADFQQVFSSTQCRTTDGFFTVLARHNGLGRPRLGLALAKRRINLAVQRNRVRRQIRESFRHSVHLLSDLDLVVLAREGLSEVDNIELSRALQRHWLRLGKQCEKS